MEAQQAALQSEDYFAFAHSDEAFHYNIFRLAKVPGLWHSIKRGQPDLSRVRHLKRVFSIRRSTEVLNEHQAIIDAICSGAKASAEAALGTYEDEFAKLSAHPLLVDYIDRINEPTPRNARTFAANAKFAREQKENANFLLR